MSDSFATSWTIAHQVPLSLGFSKQEYWSKLPLPSPGDLPDPGIEPKSPEFQADSFLPEPPGNGHDQLLTTFSASFHSLEKWGLGEVENSKLLVMACSLWWQAPIKECPQGQLIRRKDVPSVFILEKEMATRSSILAWRIPGTEEPGGLPSMRSHRVGHDWSDLA